MPENVEGVFGIYTHVSLEELLNHDYAYDLAQTQLQGVPTPPALVDNQYISSGLTCPAGNVAITGKVRYHTDQQRYYEHLLRATKQGEEVTFRGTYVTGMVMDGVGTAIQREKFKGELHLAEMKIGAQIYTDFMIDETCPVSEMD